MKFMRQYMLSLLLTFAMVSGAYAAADLGNTSVISPTDASNGSGTCPSWLGSAAPSTLDDAGRCLQGAIAREWENRSFTVTSSGSANAYVVAYTVAPAAYRTGQVYSFITNFGNTGTATVNINSLGAKTIKKDIAGVMTALASGDIASGSFIVLAYNGTDMIWINRGNAATYMVGPGSATDNAIARFDGTGGQTIQNSGVTIADTTADTTLTSTDAGAGAGPVITTDRNSASPANFDAIGKFIYRGRDSGGNSTDYADTLGFINDTTDTSEDAVVYHRSIVAGTMTDELVVGGGLVSGSATGGGKGTGTVNATDYYKNGVLATRALICTLTTTSGTTQSCTSIPAYRELYIEVAGVSFSATIAMTLAVSDDNGANYGTARAISVATGSAAGVLYGTIQVSNIQTSDSLAVGHSVTAIGATASATQLAVVMAEAGAAPAVINAIQFAGGTFDAGTIRVYGLL